MKIVLSFFATVILIAIISCRTQQIESSSNHELDIIKTTISDTSFVNIKDYSKDFVLDMKYATNDNFLKSTVYDCPTCLLRLKTIKSLIAANKAFLKKGYRIKLFDCYRPLSVQKKMWKIMPNTDYVANPTKGSVHNRGGAVDMTIVDKNGKEVDMGTPFDFFGPEAGHGYTNLSNKIIKNRLLLKTIMQANNFEAIKSEWWHYNLAGSKVNPVSDFKWNCN
jgi:zinc D-Ala-D-Ala dipeptidase